VDVELLRSRVGEEAIAEILARWITPLTDNRHPRDYFGVQLPGAPPVVFAQLRPSLTRPGPSSNEPSLISGMVTISLLSSLQADHEPLSVIHKPRDQPSIRAQLQHCDDFGAQFLNLIIVRSQLHGATRLKISFSHRPPGFVCISLFFESVIGQGFAKMCS
jgi:hypothetical protein